MSHKNRLCWPLTVLSDTSESAYLRPLRTIVLRNLLTLLVMSTWSATGRHTPEIAESPASFFGQVLEEEFSGYLFNMGEALCDDRFPLLNLFHTSRPYNKVKHNICIIKVYRYSKQEPPFSIVTHKITLLDSRPVRQAR